MTLDRAQSAPPPLLPLGRTNRPMLLARPMLLPVLDTNALLVEACSLAKHGGRRDRVTALADTGRAPRTSPPTCTKRSTSTWPAHFGMEEPEARRVLDQRILPTLRVVDLEIRDHLSPQTRHILRVDRDMPQRYRGDPDDAPTMALAEFLAPCVIVTQDSVFALSASLSSTGSPSPSACCAWLV
ncbi:hypothetical protein [Streptomyces sp. NPDC005953]|uniref:hypothetical protein n=1 Tax=Streptomyces sp. NPDC005953 TaxID=3156719 RepID=UPI0033E9AADC